MYMYGQVAGLAGEEKSGKLGRQQDAPMHHLKENQA